MPRLDPRQPACPTRFAGAFLAAALLSFSAIGGAAAQSSGSSGLVAELPVIDPAEGRALFVEKGCVICHAVNDVGGRAGPPLEAEGPSSTVDIAEFAARMWRGAGPMVWLQTLEMGYQIDLTGDDLAHLAGFLQDVDEQARFTEDTLPDHVREALLTELYRRPEDWRWEPEVD